MILFAILCGRLPFDGADLTYEDRPATSIVKSRILKGLYKIDAHVSNEAKDLLSKMLCMDPSTRITLPKVIGHPWLSHMFALDNTDSPPVGRSRSPCSEKAEKEPLTRLTRNRSQSGCTSQQYTTTNHEGLLRSQSEVYNDRYMPVEFLRYKQQPRAMAS